VLEELFTRQKIGIKAPSQLMEAVKGQRVRPGDFISGLVQGS
jgi:hypothetical protein